MSEVNEKIEHILAKADDLPVMPNIGMEILNLIDSENSVPADFEQIVENDQVMTLKILKLANSAYYGYPREIINLKEAIVILGLDTLKSLVLSLLTRQMLGNSLDSYGLQRGELWEHSMAVAMIARSIGRKVHAQKVERYFVAGLLHDVGKLLLNVFLREYAEVLKQQISEGGMNFNVAEERVLGVSHADIGAELVSRWNLPEFLVNVVRYHHDHQAAPVIYARDVYIVEMANKLASQVAPGASYDVDQTVSPEEYGKLGMTAADIEVLLEAVRDSLLAMKL